MLSFPLQRRIWVSRDPVDFRKAFDGLCGIVHGAFGRDPYSGEVFVFFNRRRDRVKLLVWDDNGFWLFYKRLERGTFEPIASISATDTVVSVERRTLLMLLEGIDTKRSRFRNHFVRSLRIGTCGGRDEADDRGRASL